MCYVIYLILKMLLKRICLHIFLQSHNWLKLQGKRSWLTRSILYVARILNLRVQRDDIDLTIDDDATEFINSLSFHYIHKLINQCKVWRCSQYTVSIYVTVNQVLQQIIMHQTFCVVVRDLFLSTHGLVHRRIHAPLHQFSGVYYSGLGLWYVYYSLCYTILWYSPIHRPFQLCCWMTKYLLGPQR